MWRLLSVMLFWGLSTTSVLAASVWSVSKGEHELYIGGTFHLLSKSDYPLPEQYDKAYAKADTLVLETDIGAFSSPEFAQYMMTTFRYQNGATIESVLKPATITRLKAYFASRQMGYDTLKYFKPEMLMSVITIAELQSIGFNKAGVDEFFHQRAEKDGKNLSWLESVKQQMQYLQAMGAGNPDELLNYTLDDLQELPELMGKLRASWREGDMKQMASLVLVEMQTTYPDIYEVLLVSRNQKWIPQIEALMQSPEKELVLVGGLHLAGRDSVLRMLQAKGYTIKKL